MKILLTSHWFTPSVGGIERVGELLARSFVELGHRVRVMTRTPGPAVAAPGVEVLRCPSPRAAWAAARWCDVSFHNNLSLRAAWPLLAVRRPWVVAHHTWLARVDGARGWQDGLKRAVLRWGSSIAVSRAVARALPVPSVVLPNPYDDGVFRELPEVARDRDLIFVGRLVSDKGVDVLLEALGRLRGEALVPGLTVVGSGQESARLKELAGALGLSGQVHFVGEKTGGELARLLNAHRLVVVPSRWQEPFGLVALEGIACGGVVVGTAGGGLPEAIGPCGVTVPNGNSQRLAEALGDLLRHPVQLCGYRARAAGHLRAHARLTVARAYLGVLERAMDRPANPFEIVPRQCTAALQEAA